MTFEEVVLPHLDAAYRVARWLLRNEPEAEDAVQEAALKALRYFGTFAGGNGRAWFLRIVRNTCAEWRRPRRGRVMELFDEQQHSVLRTEADPETLLLRTSDAAALTRAIEALPEHHRELLVLRELEELSYREVAEVLDIPMGTVMSGLSRARQALRCVILRQAHGRPEPFNTFALQPIGCGADSPD